MLGFPDFYSVESFIVHTDASYIELAYVRSQIEEGKVEVLGYESRELSEPETKYHINQLELLKGVFIGETFFSYMYVCLCFVIGASLTIWNHFYCLMFLHNMDLVAPTIKEKLRKRFCRWNLPPLQCNSVKAGL